MKAAALVLFSALGSTPPKETRTTIAVVDTGYNSSDKEVNKFLCKGGALDFTGKGIDDVQAHGNVMARTIIKGLNPVMHCLYVIKYIHQIYDKAAYMAALNYMLVLKPDYLNFSSNGEALIPLEFSVYNRLAKGGTKIFVAAGNNGLDLDFSCNSYPACFVHLIDIVVAVNTSVTSNKISKGTKGPYCTIVDKKSTCGTSSTSAILLNETLKGDR